MGVWELKSPYLVQYNTTYLCSARVLVVLISHYPYHIPLFGPSLILGIIIISNKIEKIQIVSISIEKSHEDYLTRIYKFST